MTRKRIPNEFLSVEKGLASGRPQIDIARDLGIKHASRVSALSKCRNLPDEILTLLRSEQVYSSDGIVMSRMRPMQIKEIVEWLKVKPPYPAWSAAWFSKGLKKMVSGASAVEAFAQGNASTDPNLISLERQIAERLGTDVKLEFSGYNGKMIIHFFGYEVLDGILERLGLSEN